MTEISEEAQRAINEAVKREVGVLKDEIIEGVKAVVPQPAASTKQDDCPGCVEKQKHIDELTEDSRQWQTGGKYLKYDRVLHSSTPESAAAVQEHFKDWLMNLKRDDLTLDERKQLFKNTGPTGATVHIDDDELDKYR